MYLRRVRLRNVKRFADFTLDLTDPASGRPRMWTVVIGENGTGKTSLLQAIALAAAGRAHVNGLARPLLGHLRDRRTSQGSLRVDSWCVPSTPAGWTPGATCLRTYFEQEPGESALQGADLFTPADDMRPAERTPLERVRAKNEPGYFVAAYGVGRFLPTPAEAAPLQQPSIERLESLFGVGRALTSLRFIDLFAGPEGRHLHFSRELAALVRGPDLLPGLADLELRGAGGVKAAGDLLERDRVTQRLGRQELKLPAVALAHGHQSTLAWIADLFGHFMLEAGGTPKPSDVRGLVLIDEIDLYLHPRWQRTLIPSLKAAFPNVQFVVTTHSPVVLANVPPSEVVVLQADDGTGDVRAATRDPQTGDWSLKTQADATVRLPDPRVMTGTELYEQYFQVGGLTPSRHGRDLRRLLMLATDPFRNDDEDAEARRLRSELTAKGLSELPDLVAREQNGGSSYGSAAGH